VTGTEVATAAILLGVAWLLWRMIRSSGSDGDSFMSKVVKVALLVMVIAGGMVWLIDQEEEASRTPDNGSQNEPKPGPKQQDKPKQQNPRN
jgi:hypothetical protein